MRDTDCPYCGQTGEHRPWCPEERPHRAGEAAALAEQLVILFRADPLDWKRIAVASRDLATRAAEEASLGEFLKKRD